MSVEVNVSGMRCGASVGGLDCTYCYQRSVRHAVDSAVPKVDHAAVQKQLAELVQGEGGSFTLFGGEPLLAPLKDLERMWAFGLEKYGRNGVQTGGRPITDQHFELFRRYKVMVGFSIDGPGELNDARWAGSVTKTRRATNYSIACLERCMADKIGVSLIVTLSQKNASPERLPKLLAWLEYLDGLGGLYAVCLHVLEHDGLVQKLALTHDENLSALLAARDLELKKLQRIHIGLFRDVLALLRGQDVWQWKDGSPAGVSCVWAGCDPWTTVAVKGVEPDGSRSLCQRVHKGGAAWAPTESGPLVRQLALRETPINRGGCAGCRQIITCKGHCPGTAIDGDWRKRSRDCELWRRLFEHFENVLIQAGETPVTLRSDRNKIEQVMADAWSCSWAIRIKDAVEIVEGKQPAVPRTADGTRHGDYEDHGDHTDAGAGYARMLASAVIKEAVV